MCYKKSYSLIAIDRTVSMGFAEYRFEETEDSLMSCTLSRAPMRLSINLMKMGATA